MVCSWYHRNRLLLVYTGNSLWAFPRWFPTTSSNRGTRAAHTDLSSAFRCPLRCCLSGSNRVRTMTCQEAPIEEHIAGQTEEQTEPRKTKGTSQRNNSHVSAPHQPLKYPTTPPLTRFKRLPSSVVSLSLVHAHSSQVCFQITAPRHRAVVGDAALPGMDLQQRPDPFAGGAAVGRCRGGHSREMSTWYGEVQRAVERCRT